MRFPCITLSSLILGGHEKETKECGKVRGQPQEESPDSNTAGKTTKALFPLP